MKASQLERVTFRPAEDAGVDKMRAELAERAAKELGYTRLAKATSNISGLPLLAALKSLDIQPFTKASVSKYKKSKEHYGMYSGTKQWLKTVALAVVTIPASAFLLTHVGPTETFYTVLDVIGGVIVGLTALISLFASVACFKDFVGRGRRTVCDWDRTNLTYFAGDIPEHVLDRALAIKKTCPDVNFYIDALRYREEHNPAPPRLSADPFLVAETTNSRESYYVDVWDEKKYEETL